LDGFKQPSTSQGTKLEAGAGQGVHLGIREGREPPGENGPIERIVKHHIHVVALCIDPIVCRRGVLRGVVGKGQPTGAAGAGRLKPLPQGLFGAEDVVVAGQVGQVAEAPVDRVAGDVGDLVYDPAALAVHRLENQRR
jgi:hypothetical protein